MNAKTVSISHRLALPMALLAIVLVAAVGVWAAEPLSQGPVTTGFSYQGRLATEGGGDPITDNCDFQFALWDDPLAGSQVGPELNPTGVAVTDGLFTVQLDFGEVFDGTALWLEVAVLCTGDPGYTTLTPRQALTAAPYAAYALNAQTADLLDGYHGSYYLDATHISSGTLGAGYYSAYDDLGVEGYLDDGEGDLARNNNVLQPTLNADLLDGYHATDLALAGHDHWGQAWTGAGTGLTLSGGDFGLHGSGSVYGVLAAASIADGTGVYGQSTAGDGIGQGVRGESYSSSGRGVYGHAMSTTGTTYGVYGRSSSNSGTGVYGLADAASGTTYGVYGQSDATYGTGVNGQGFSGVSARGEYYGVYADGDYYGVYADGDDTGVFGTTSSTDGAGLIGHAASAGGSADGVVGTTYAPDGYGGYFYAYGGTGTQTQAGVYAHGSSNVGYGVVGDNGVNGTGVGAWSYTGYLIQAHSGLYPYGTLRFYITNNGTVYADGGYNTFMTTATGDGSEYRTLYSMTSAEAWSEDFGSATLKDGGATVTIDPIFAKTVNLAVEYHVYLTPVCSELIVMAVTGKGPDSFTVQGATLDAKPSGCAFDYRIVAKQLGHEGERLEKVDIPEPVEVDREEIDTPGVVGPEPEGGR